MTMPGAGDGALRSLYQEIILKHYRSPENRGEVEDADCTVHMNNPVCGDEVILSLRLEGDRVAAARFKGQGCSISQASASMMTTLVQDLPVADAHRLHELFKAMLHDETDEPDKALGDARALAGVARFPARVRCALLPWNALDEALGRATGQG